MWLESLISSILFYWERTYLMSIRSGQKILCLNQLLEELLLPMRIENSTRQRRSNWVIKASSERIKNDFRFKMLSKGTKTSIQYWLDGLSYPTLREVAINDAAWLLQVLIRKEVFQQWDLSIQNFATNLQQTKPRNWFLSRTMHHSWCLLIRLALTGVTLMTMKTSIRMNA